MHWSCPNTVGNSTTRQGNSFSLGTAPPARRGGCSHLIKMTIRPSLSQGTSDSTKQGSTQNESVILKYCPTKQMVAHALTKALAQPDFERLRAGMNIEAAQPLSEGEC